MKAKRDLCDKEVINGFSFFSFCFSLSSPSHTQTHTQPTGLSSVCFLKTLILPTSKDRNELLPCKYRQLVFPHMYTQTRAHRHTKSRLVLFLCRILPFCLSLSGAEELILT